MVSDFKPTWYQNGQPLYKGIYPQSEQRVWSMPEGVCLHSEWWVWSMSKYIEPSSVGIIIGIWSLK